MKYQIQIDVTFTGELYLEAKDAKEAAEKVKAKYLGVGDIRNFRFLSLDVVDIEVEEE